MSRLDNYLIEVTPSPLKEVEKKLLKYKSKIVKAHKTSRDVEEFTNKLSRIFASEKIIFFPLTEHISDAHGDYIARAKVWPRTGDIHVWVKCSDDPLTITLGVLDPNLDINHFLEELLTTLSHEFIHKAQFEKSKVPPQERAFGSIGEYLAYHYETEAWAHTVYLELKQGITETLSDILFAIRGNKKLFQRFMKKLYLYAKGDKDVLDMIKRVK